jgi:transposase
MLRSVVAAAEQEEVAVQERETEIDRLQLLIKRLLRHQFGRRSEQLRADQLALGLEDLEQGIGAREAEQEAADPAAKQPRPTAWDGSHAQSRRSSRTSAVLRGGDRPRPA